MRTGHPAGRVLSLFLFSLGVMSVGAGSALALPADTNQAEAATASPQIVGVWSWTDTAQCSETYEYLPDGSGRVVSGEERSEFAWVLDPKRTDSGFHRLDATIMKDHGGNDCTGSAEDDTNRRHTVYVKFHPEGDQHIVCFKPELEQCFGPLRRQTGAVR